MFWEIETWEINLNLQFHQLNYLEGNKWNQSSFPVIYKVGKIGIFVRLLIGINWKQQSTKSVSKQIYITYGTFN